MSCLCGVLATDKVGCDLCPLEVSPAQQLHAAKTPAAQMQQNTLANCAMTAAHTLHNTSTCPYAALVETAAQHAVAGAACNAVTRFIRFNSKLPAASQHTACLPSEVSSTQAATYHVVKSSTMVPMAVLGITAAGQYTSECDWCTAAAWTMFNAFCKLLRLTSGTWNP